MASVTYGKCIMANVNMAKVFMAKVSWQMKLSPRTVSVPPCKYSNGRFTTIPLKTLPDQVCIIYLCLYFESWLFSLRKRQGILTTRQHTQ